MPVNLSNSAESVELEILQVGDQLNEQLSGRLANLHAVFFKWPIRGPHYTTLVPHHSLGVGPPTALSEILGNYICQ
jgi:hypothetical protein